MIVNATIDYSPTPEEIAQEFCDFYEDGQSIFLNKVAEIFNKKGNSLAMQLEYISQCRLLSVEARQLMQQFGEYSFHNFNTQGE